MFMLPPTKTKKKSCYILKNNKHEFKHYTLKIICLIFKNYLKEQKKLPKKLNEQEKNK